MFRNLNIANFLNLAIQNFQSLEKLADPNRKFNIKFITRFSEPSSLI